MNTTEIISMNRLPFCSDITRYPLLGSHIHNHRLCWPPDVFVENPILSYNYKNIYVQNACTFCVHVQNILCVYCTRIGQNILPSYNLYGQQKSMIFQQIRRGCFCIVLRKNILSKVWTKCFVAQTFCFFVMRKTFTIIDFVGLQAFLLKIHS